MNTIEDLEKMFPTEESARKYLVNLRWGQWAQCPYCGNKKAYIIEKGERFKCANKECYKKFSVTVKSILEASNIPILTIVNIYFLYAKSRGRISPFEIIQNVKISAKTEFLIREKLDFIWKYIDRAGKSTIEIFDDMFKTSFDVYEKFNEIKQLPHYNSPFSIKEINDISDVKQYNQLLRYAKYYMNVFCEWIFLDFASPAEIISETFLWMRDNNIKEYNAETILRHIRNITQKMWVNFLNNHPQYNEQYKRQRKMYKEEQRRNLSENYILDVLCNRKYNTLTRKEMRANRKLIEDTRKKIIEIRKENKSIYDFESHFR